MPAAVPCDATPPFEHQRLRAAGHFAINDFKGVDVHLDLLALINGMKMRRRMVAIKHADDDPVKPAQFRHVGRLFNFKWQARSLQTAAIRLRRSVLTFRIPPAIEGFTMNHKKSCLPGLLALPILAMLMNAPNVPAQDKPAVPYPTPANPSRLRPARNPPLVSLNWRTRRCWPCSNAQQNSRPPACRGRLQRRRQCQILVVENGGGGQSEKPALPKTIPPERTCSALPMPRPRKWRTRSKPAAARAGRL